MSSRREYSKYLAELLLSEDLDARRSGFIRSVIFEAWHEFLEETIGKEALSPEMIEEGISEAEDTGHIFMEIEEKLEGDEQKTFRNAMRCIEIMMQKGSSTNKMLRRIGIEVVPAKPENN